jgi:hypothetical protein
MLFEILEPSARVHVLMWYDNSATFVLFRSHDVLMCLHRRYQVAQFLAQAAGSFTSGMLVRMLETRFNWETEAAYRAVFALYALLAFFKIVTSLAMSSISELSREDVTESRGSEATAATPSAATADETAERQPLLDRTETPPARPVRSALSLMLVLAPLFGLDAFASSLMPSSFISYYLRLQFLAPLTLISSLLSTGSILSGMSSLVSGSLSRRVGLVNTMVFTHLPAQIFTISIGSWARTSLGWTIGLLIARYCTASMDTPARNAFLAALLPKETRTKVMGVVNVTKTLAASVGPVRFSAILTTLGFLSVSR